MKYSDYEHLANELGCKFETPSGLNSTHAGFSGSYRNRAVSVSIVSAGKFGGGGTRTEISYTGLLKNKNNTNVFEIQRKTSLSWLDYFGRGAIQVRLNNPVIDDNYVIALFDDYYLSESNLVGIFNNDLQTKLLELQGEFSTISATRNAIISLKTDYLVSRRLIDFLCDLAEKLELMPKDKP